MKRRFALLAASAVLIFALTACSARNDSGTGDVNSVTPDTTPSAVPGDQMPGNDANEGGGAGGTNHDANGDGSSTNPGYSTQDGNGLNRDDGVLDNVGDAAGDLMRGIGNGVGNALDRMGNAARDGGNAAGKAVTPKK